MMLSKHLVPAIRMDAGHENLSLIDGQKWKCVLNQDFTIEPTLKHIYIHKNGVSFFATATHGGVGSSVGTSVGEVVEVVHDFSLSLSPIFSTHL